MSNTWNPTVAIAEHMERLRLQNEQASAGDRIYLGRPVPLPTLSLPQNRPPPAPAYRDPFKRIPWFVLKSHGCQTCQHSIFCAKLRWVSMVI
ncbi:uncharacterized protein N7479_004253 [Penicillium vulpinum]|uniref:uncharacterized protein n=1 Tax=Penicillium vulpinum TaxID=29845 RepID=UPI0025489616|nr:uncharacterized protein N7479_004253 [Penicillium vulpinum]KAJ5964377.1 hypothetical protein N7479_004253 [Penicillium vulpinum]